MVTLIDVAEVIQELLPPTTRIVLAEELGRSYIFRLCTDVPGAKFPIYRQFPIRRQHLQQIGWGTEVKMHLELQLSEHRNDIEIELELSTS
jgi:hypothetical protein